MSKIKAMNRRDWLWLAGLVVAGLAYWRCRGVDGSGKAATEQRDAAAFEAIEVNGEVQLEVRAGAERSVEVSGDDNLVGLVETTVRGDVLVIDSKRNLDPDLPLVVRVTTPELRKVTGSGSVDIDVRGIDSEELAIDLSGAGKIRAAGRTERLRIEISGAGEADTRELAARRVEIDVSGSGDVDVGEPEELDVEVSGAASVSYGGNPKVRQDISGAGKISKR